MRTYYAYDDYWEDRPAVQIWETPEEIAEYERVRENHFTFGYDAGLSVEEVRKRIAPQIEPHNACRTCNGKGQMGKLGGGDECLKCRGTGMRAYVTPL